jgi:hypothetical protein
MQCSQSASARCGSRVPSSRLVAQRGSRWQGTDHIDCMAACASCSSRMAWPATARPRRYLGRQPASTAVVDGDCGLGSALARRTRTGSVPGIPSDLRILVEGIRARPHRGCSNSKHPTGQAHHSRSAGSRPHCDDVAAGGGTNGRGFREGQGRAVKPTGSTRSSMRSHRRGRGRRP